MNYQSAPQGRRELSALGRYLLLVKCDQIEPACSQCLRAEKTCPGYRDLTTLLFRDENETVIRKAKIAKARTEKQKTGKSSKLGTTQTTSPKETAPLSVTSQSLTSFPPSRSPSLCLSISTGIEDEGISFFFTRYGNNVCTDTKTGQVNPSQSPLWKAISDNFSLCNAVSSVGFAGLSNVSKSKTHMIIARKKYAQALQEITSVLNNASEADLGKTFKAVMMLAAFEVSAK
jgi:hypothetical protein